MSKEKQLQDLSIAFSQAKYERNRPHLRVISSKQNSNKERVLKSSERDLIERRKSLIKELYNETRNSEFNDERERFSLKGDFQNNKISSIATKLFTKKSKLQNKKIKKKDFNLDEDFTENFDDQNGLIGDLEFTHKGKSLSSIDDSTISKYENHNDYESEEVLDEKAISGFFFGQGNMNETTKDDTKSRKEIFREIMEKSKMARIEMKRSRENQEEELLNLNDAFNEVQSFLKFKQSKKERINSLISNNLDKITEFTKISKLDIDDYEMIRSELRFDTRSGVSDRIKTNEEIAKENAKKLEKLEKERKERMSMDVNLGLEDEEDDEILTVDSNKSVVIENYESDSNEEFSDDQEFNIDSTRESDEEISTKINKSEIDDITNFEKYELFHLDDLASIEWLKNDDDEQELPFSINLRKILDKYNLEELTNFLGKFSPISQWKFINRFRACFDKGDTSMLNDLKLLFGFLIKYPLRYIHHMQCKNKDIIFEFIIKYLKLMNDHLLFMVETDPKECLIIFSYFTLEICYTTFPSIVKSKKVEKFLNLLLDVEDENYYTEILEECPSLYQLSDDIYELTLEHIFMCRMMFLLFPVTDAQHPILTPVIICLEQWAYRWSQVGKSFLNTNEFKDDFKHNQIRLVNNPNIKCIIGVINLLEISSIGYFNTETNNTEKLSRFSIGYFTLSLSCLKWLTTVEHSNKNSILLAIGILKSLSRVIDIFKDIEGFHAIVSHLFLPNLRQIELFNFSNDGLLSSIEYGDSLVSLISEITKTCLEISNKCLKPINLCERQVPTIRTLTPKLDDPSVPFAAKAMLKSKSNFKESQKDLERRLYVSRIKKELNTVRRQTNRQLRKDAQVIASIWHENKNAKSKKQQAKYNSFIKMLEDDQVEYKKMRTTGGTMDTSLQSYRSNKQIKKNNKRMGGNKTASGIIH